MTSVDSAPEAMQWVASLLQRLAGHALPPEKDYLLQSRLLPVARRFGMPDVASLLRALQNGGNRPLEQAVAEAMATHETSFFRDPNVFQCLRTHVLPKLFQDNGQRVRLWSAAASTGQEAISLAILCLELLGERAEGRVEILATDFSSAVLARMRAGIYTAFEVQRGLPAAMLVRYFEKCGRDFQICPAVARLIRCEQHNLLDSAARFGRFDVILLRNVLIYMDAASRRRVLEHVHAALKPEGWLVLGVTESVSSSADLFQPDPLGHVFYRPLVRRGTSGDASFPVRI